MQIRPHIPLWLRAPRSSLFLVLAVVLLACIAVVSPVQLPVALYKLTLIALVVLNGTAPTEVYSPSLRAARPISKPGRRGTTEPEGDADFRVVSGYELVFTAAMLRRAVVVGCVVIGVAMGL